MEGEYIIIRNGVQETYTNWNDIPDQFEHIISFKPTFEEGVAHTDEDHAELAKMNTKLQELMEIERASSNANR